MRKIKTALVTTIFAATIFGTTATVFAAPKSFSNWYSFVSFMNTRQFSVTKNNAAVYANIKSTSKRNNDGETTMRLSMYKTTWYGAKRVNDIKSQKSTQNKNHTWYKINKGDYYIRLSNDAKVFSKGTISVYS